MRKILLFCLLFSSTGYGQQIGRNLYAYAPRIPDSLSNTTTGIAQYIKDHYQTDLEKINAGYSWVISNIRYDTDSSNQINLGTDPEAKVHLALKRRKGVCENFAAILQDILVKAGLEAFVIRGYTRQGGNVDQTGHSWVTLKLGNEWLLCDPTWDAGLGSSARFFLVNPGDFILSHMPFDPMWQMLNFPVNNDEFYSGYSQGKEKLWFNYKDSISAFVQMDSLKRFQSIASRIQKSGLKNDLVKDDLAFQKMQIEMINQDKDVDYYNSAVAELNEATNILNYFLKFRNQQFEPVKPDNEMRGLLSGIDELIISAGKKLDQLDRSQAKFAISSEPVRNRLNGLAKRIKEQKDFLSRYLALARSERKSLFYQ